MAVIGSVLVANAALAQGGVLVLGGPPPVPVVQPVAYAEPVVYQQPTTIVVQGPVVIQSAAGGYYGAPDPACYPSAATVIYVAGPGGCARDYCPPIGCQSPNVIYFGRGQASQQGYNFTHRR